MMTTYGRFTVGTIGILMILVMVTACGDSKANGKGGPGAPEVAVMTIQPERVVLSTELPGRTSAHLVAEVRPQVSGIIRKRLFAEGADVKAGSVLYEIDPATYEAALAASKALLARSEANLVSLRNRVERYKELFAINAVSKQDLEDAVAALAQAEADIQANKASVQTAQINLAYTQVKAPITGRIGKSDVTVGALVTASQPTSLAVIQSLDPVYVDATQSSASLLQLKQGLAAGKISDSGRDRAKAKLLLEDGTPYPIDGTLKFSDVTVDPSTGSLILRMEFPNPKHTLLPGMYVRTIIQEGTIPSAILAPQQGVSRDPKGNPVALIVNGEGKVEPRMLTIDRAIGNKWLITQGLKQGDRLIVEGIQKVRPGVPVKAVAFDPNPKNGAPPPQAPNQQQPKSAERR
jgi:membrane fusion protein, multidrug efflux system